MIPTRFAAVLLIAVMGIIRFAPAQQPPAPAAPPASPAPHTMKAVRVHSIDGVDVFKYEDLPRPEPKDGELLVRVIAAGVNPVGPNLRAYLHSVAKNQPIMLGWDIAGIVESVGGAGQTATKFERGDAILAPLPLLRGEGYAEFAIVDAAFAVAKPKSLTFVEAAAVPLAAMTAWQALIDAGGLKKGQTVLIQGGSGGIGTFAVQIAKSKGAKVIATASTANQDYLKELGADVAVDYKTQKFEDYARDVDVVLETVGGETQKRSFNVLKKGGVLISLVGDPDQDLAKERGVTAQGFFTQPDAVSLQQVAALIDAGQVKVRVSQVFPLADAAKAYEQLETGHIRGKIVLRVAEEPGQANQ